MLKNEHQSYVWKQKIKSKYLQLTKLKVNVLRFI